MSAKVTSNKNGTHCFIEEYEECSDDEDEDCEIELVVQGRTIPVSEKLLCEHSMYFKKIFSDFDENQETIILKHSKLAGEDIPEDKQQEPLALISFITMTTIVEFLYTGILKINDQNVRQLLYASDLLSMSSVESSCFTYLKSQLTIRNCVRSFLLASAKKSWKSLADFIKKFIVQHFDKLRKSAGIFKLFSAEQFKEIIGSENLNIQYEEQVYDAVFDWIGIDEEVRKTDLPLLFEEIQWPLVRSPKYFMEALADPLIMENEKCTKLLAEGYKYFNMSYMDKLKYWKENLTKPTRWPKLLAVLSYAEKLIECYDFESETWFVMTEKPGYMFGSTMCYLKGKLYTLGGVQSKTVDRYDPETDSWKDFFPSLRHCRVAHGCVALDDKIFVTGGSAKANANFGPGLYEMECLKVEEDESIKPEWKVAGTMQEGRSFLGSAAVAGKIYQIGGCLSEDYSTTEVWDPKTGKFSDIAVSLCKRDSQGQAVIDGEIYCVGGFDNIMNNYLDSVEKYSPARDKWTKVPRLSLPRRSAGVVNYRDMLYAVGGMGEEEDLSSVEVFCPTSSEWTMLPSPMKEVNGWCTACLVEKPVRMLEEHRAIVPTKEGLGCDWECDSVEADRRDSVTSSTSGHGSEDKGRKNWDWTTSDNARTEQRMKKMKDLQKK